MIPRTLNAPFDVPLSRRELLALAAAAGLGCHRLSGAAADSRWGLQLYTVRNLFSRDPDGTLAAIAKIGYRDVETAGYANRSPADFRRALDATGLASPSAHLQGDIRQLGTTLPQVLDACATIGHKWLIVPSLPGALRTVDGYKQAGEMLARAAAGAKSAGVRVGYHNHDIDFAPIGGTTGMELILQSSSADVAVELDVYWIVKAHGDPFAFIAQHPGRVKLLHLKDASPAPELAMRDVGAGTIDWPRLLPQAAAAGVEHLFVEHDQPGDALASVAASFAYLSHVGKS